MIRFKGLAAASCWNPLGPVNMWAICCRGLRMHRVDCQLVRWGSVRVQPCVEPSVGQRANGLMGRDS